MRKLRSGGPSAPFPAPKVPSPAAHMDFPVSATHARRRASVPGPNHSCVGDPMARKQRAAPAALTLSLVLVAATTVSCLHEGPPVPPTLPPAQGPTTTAHPRPPNIILITTDDQNPDELRW